MSMQLISIRQPSPVQVIAMGKDFAYLDPSARVIMATLEPLVQQPSATLPVPMEEHAMWRTLVFVLLVMEALIVL